MDKVVIGFVSRSDPMTDRVSWSGTPYKIREAIENAGFEVIWIKVPAHRYLSYFNRIISKLPHLAAVWKYTNIYGWLCARSINVDDVFKCDILFFPFGFQIIKSLINRLSKKPPIIYYSDSCFKIMEDYYWYSIPNWIRRQANSLEQSALDNSDVVIRSSDWAIKSAILDYNCDKEKCYVLEFGPNLDTKDIIQSSAYNGGELRLFFSGVSWNRKGGDLAVKIVELLREKGIDAKLIIAGPRKIPVSCINKKHIEFVGYLNKKNPSDYKKYIELYQQCHIFLFPTKAECSAIVYSEAAAAGLPCYTYLTGGSGNYVINGINGYALPKGSNADAFVEQIYFDIINNNLENLRKGALTMFKKRLSWEAWAEGFKDIMETGLNRSKIRL